MFEFTKKEYDFFIENAGLTDEEVTVLNFKRRGFTHYQIADEMGYSYDTIKNRVKSIKKKIIKCI